MKNSAQSGWLSLWDQFLKQHPVLDIVDRTLPFATPNDAPEKIAKDESFWQSVQTCFPASDRVVNLNNGAVSSSPRVVENAYTSYYSLVNSAPSYYIWKVMEAGKEIIREGLATLINCSSDEIAIFRNATEALNNAIFGIALNAGDEVVACKQDYVKTISSWKQRELREGIKVVWVDLTGTETNAEIVEKFVSAFSPKTKVVQVTHVINWNGLVLPARDIIQSAKARNILTVLDAAHSFGILDTDVADLGCDYMGTALHKWLSGPIPSGMLYIRKKNIAGTWPLASAADPVSDNIRKFEELSIQLLPNVIGLGYAIEFHLKLGRENKEHRLRHLRRYWIDKIKNTSGVTFNTPFVEEQCAVIANLALLGWEPPALENELLTKYTIHVGIVLLQNLQGIRVTPNIYTTTEELDAFVHAFSSIAKG